MTDSASNAQKDSIMESFIALLSQYHYLQYKIKASLNQEQVISIASSRGYEFDSLTILRK